MRNLKIISAGAGSGKTYTLTQEMATLLTPKDGRPAAVRASGIIATTFTNKAAAELKERVRIKLLEEGLTAQADELGNAMIGTVHAIGVQLLKRFSFEAGVSPEVDIVADTDQQTLFNRSLSSVVSLEIVAEMETLAEQLGFNKSSYEARDWRRDLKQLTDIARSNNFSVAVLEASKAYSLESFFELLPPCGEQEASYYQERLQQLLSDALHAVRQSSDATKKKDALLQTLHALHATLSSRGHLPWYEWARLSKISAKAPKKCQEDVAELEEFAKNHDQHPAFHDNIRRYVTLLFDTAIDVLEEYEQYKNVRGLIDYIDMEVLILKLLDNEQVREVLRDEIDLLLVDEFQDTNPIQLDIFLQLTELANQSIWVGDPKQSIYGFRGAAPDLMKAVMDSAPEIDNLPCSWRSRQDLVHLSNGLFAQAFKDELPIERIALQTAPPFTKDKEAACLGTAAHHWHFDFEGNRPPSSPWLEECIAQRLHDILEEGWQVRVKGSNATRPLRAGDVAILCRSNYGCQKMAEALHKVGLKASIARNGLLQTAEVSLLLACLRYLLNKHDALAIAEVLVLARQEGVEALIADRLAYLEEREQSEEAPQAWGHQHEEILRLQDLRYKSKELSTTEILNGVIEQLDIRRMVAAWDNEGQRLDNIDALRQLAVDYEATCQRLHTAATLGGFLLWIGDLEQQGLDEQGKGAGPDSVNVLTYHKSKGLEWGLVICHSLDNNLKENIWGIRLVRQTPTIDLKQPLANRLLCYWINPYSDQSGGTALEERINSHAARQQATGEALAEEARLLYVGITRARDYLVFPSLRKKPTKWLNRVFHKDEKIPSLEVSSEHLLWLWQKQEIPIRGQRFFYAINTPTTDSVQAAIPYLQPRAGAQTNHKVQMLESAQALVELPDFKLGTNKIFHKPWPIPVQSELEWSDVRELVVAYLQGDQPSVLEEALRLQRATKLLNEYGWQEHWTGQQLVDYSAAFYKKIDQEWGSSALQKFQTFRCERGGQSFVGSIDFVVQDQQGGVVLLQYLTQELAQLGHHKNKLKEEVAHLLAAQSHWEQLPEVKRVRMGLIQPLEGQWRLIHPVAIPVQQSLFE